MLEASQRFPTPENWNPKNEGLEENVPFKLGDVVIFRFHVRYFFWSSSYKSTISQRRRKHAVPNTKLGK